MPKIFEWNGYKFFFYSNESIPLEPCHIHVRKGENVAKYWIQPSVVLASSWGFNPKELNTLIEVIYQNQNLIEEKWNEYFNI